MHLQRTIGTVSDGTNGFYKLKVSATAQTTNGSMAVLYTSMSAYSTTTKYALNISQDYQQILLLEGFSIKGFQIRIQHKQIRMLNQSKLLFADGGCKVTVFGQIAPCSIQS